MEEKNDIQLRRILLIANANSKWVMRYVQKMHSENRTITLINDAQSELKEKDSYYEYYRSHNVKVLTINDSNLYTRCLTCISYINQMDDFDVCHIMFLSSYASLVAKYCENKFRRIVANFFGSDFYKASSLMKQHQKMMLDIADSIIVPIEKMKSELSAIYPEFKDKINTVYFESQVMHILKNKVSISDNSGNILKEIEEEQIVIAAGYKGGAHQQHEMFIDALNNCSKDVRQKVFVIFMMTYGLTSEYEECIKEKLENAKFRYVIIKEFLNDEQMALLRRKIDIFVNMVETDAFNAAIQESLYCQSVVLCGSWLNYPVLNEEDAYIIAFDNEKELSFKLEDAITRLDYHRSRSMSNKAVISRIDDRRGHVEDWSSFYADSRTCHQNSSSDELYLYLLQNAKMVNERNRIYKDIMELWLRKRLNRLTPVSDFILAHQYEKIVIYGAGTLGELVYQEIKDMKADIIVCDKIAQFVDWSDRRITNLDSLKEKCPDCIIVTPVHVFEEIEKELAQKFIKSKIISLLDILKNY
ncbi:MAG: hypothetical protein HDT39_09035 [Lachnospiraceae bacterium]|nr:hypothetical protein [Lachnospiraceae bacterium]